MSAVSRQFASILLPWAASCRSEGSHVRRGLTRGLWGVGGGGGGPQRKSRVRLATCSGPRPGPTAAHLVVGPAGLPDAQRLGLGELALEAEQEPAVAEEHLQAVLAQGHQVLVEARVRQPQQLPQVQLGDAGRSARGPGPSARSAWAGHPRKPCARSLRATCVGTCFLYAAPGVSRLFASLAQTPDCSRGRGVTRAGGVYCGRGG